MLLGGGASMCAPAHAWDKEVSHMQAGSALRAQCAWRGQDGPDWAQHDTCRLLMARAGCSWNPAATHNLLAFQWREGEQDKQRGEE